MSGNYRVEISSTARAGCSATHCKNEGLKIGKGEIRQGVTVVFNEHTSIKWRHWGCVTPSVLHNWYATAEGDLDLIDGYEELPEDAQNRVKRAFEQGHVDDEDWNGDPEMNRYNPDKKMQGMFKKPETQAERKKKEKAEAAANGEEPPKKKRATKKRKPADDEDDKEEPEAPPPKKSRAKKAKTEDADGEDEAPPPKKSRAKKAKAEQTEDADDEAATKPAPKKSRAKKAATEGDEPAAKAPKRKAKAKKAAVEEDDGEEE